MGGSSSKNQITNINQSQWRSIGNENGAQIMRSNSGEVEGQIRVIPVDPKHEKSKQLSIYNYRKNCDSPLVKCLGASFSQSDHKTFCGNQQNVKVLTQRIPRRLQDFNTLSFPQSLYTLSQCFEGFQDLTEKAGLFQITNKMIGANNNGQVKVWLNENFGENHPTFQKPILQTTMTTSELFSQKSSEQKLIQNVMDLVQAKTQQGKFPQDFKLSMRNNKTFYEAYNKLHDYIKSKGIFVPARLQSGSSHKSYTPQVEINKKIEYTDRNTYLSNYEQSENKQNTYAIKTENFPVQQVQQQIYQSQPLYSNTFGQIKSQHIPSITTVPNSIYYLPSNPAPVSMSYINQPYRYGAYSPRTQIQSNVIRINNTPIAYPSPKSNVSFNYQNLGSQFVRQY